MTPHPRPHIGDDTYQIIDHAVTALGRERGIAITNELGVLHLLASLIEQAERWLPHHVEMARHGDPESDWDDIAAVLGTTAEQARARFGEDSPTADGKWPYDIDEQDRRTNNF